MRRVLRSLGLATLVVAGLLPLLPSPARALTVRVDPPDSTVACADTVVVRVVSDDVFADLKAYQLMFHYSSSVLRFVGAEAGDVLTGSGRPYTVEELPDVADPPDTAWVDCAQLVGSAATPGVLIYLRFATLHAGDGAIECLGVDFRDSWNQQTLPECEGAVLHVATCPVSARPVSWGSLKTIYR